MDTSDSANIRGGSLLKVQSPLKASGCGEPREELVGNQQGVERSTLHEEEREDGHLTETAKGIVSSQKAGGVSIFQAKEAFTAEKE